MTENPLRTIWRNGGAAANCWMSIPSAYAAEILAHQGWDSLTIDMQHGPIDQATAYAMIQATAATSSVPLVRVPWNQPAAIMNVLDAGTGGVICPMVNTAEEAARFVGASRYPPLGYRSNGPNRVALEHENYTAIANDYVITFAQIESAEAMENLDEICAVEGLDALLLGPSDLALSMGEAPSANPTNPVVLEAIDRVRQAASAHGLKVANFCTDVEYAAGLFELGDDMVTAAVDTGLLRHGAELLARVKHA